MGRNQHYLPQFYLRNFSFKQNNTIGLYNLKNSKYINNAPIKHQSSRPFYYGYDGNIENIFSRLEFKLANYIRSNIINNNNDFKIDNPDYIYELITMFLVRNPKHIESHNNFVELFEKELKNILPNKQFPPLNRKSHQDSVNSALSMYNEINDIIKDLNIHFLINKTKDEFISSDSPVVRYNQFFEYKKYIESGLGFNNLGLQLFLPISSKICMIIYDSKIYQLNKSSSTNIINEKDIFSINKLQCLNCLENLYFMNTDVEYIKKLLTSSLKQREEFIPKTSSGNMIYKYDNHFIKKDNSKIVLFQQEKSNIGLKINGLKIKKKFHKMNLKREDILIRNKMIQ